MARSTVLLISLAVSVLSLAAATGPYPVPINPFAWVVDQRGFSDAEALKTIRWPEDELKTIRDRPKTAIAFSGGGTRAFIASLGYLRGLADLSLLQKIRYASGISGGSWAITAFTFFEKKYTDSMLTYLGPVLDPSNATRARLREVEKGCGRASVVDKNLIDICLGKLATGDGLSKVWRDAVWEVYLEPAGVEKDALVTWSDETQRAILDRNPELEKCNFSWIMPCKGNCSSSVVGRPFPLFGSTLLGPVSLLPLSRKNRSYTMLEMTPLYVGEAVVQNITFNGEPPLFSKKGKTETLQLGGFQESFSFSSIAPKETLPDSLDGTKAVSGVLKGGRMDFQGCTVEDMAGMSSWALSDFIATLAPVAKGLEIELPMWSPVHNASSAGGESATTTGNFGDGGCSDNLNLGAVIRRGVTSTVLFFTVEHPLSPADQWDPFTQQTAKEIDANVDSLLPAYFGRDVDPGGNHSIGWDYSRAGYFSFSDFAPTVSKLQQAQATGRGAVVTVELTTVENKWQGVPAGHRMNVTFVYLSRASEWEQQLPEETRRHVVPAFSPRDPTKTPSLGPFHNFPHYNTFTQLHLSMEQANLLSDLSGWVVLQNAELFKAALAG